VIYSGYDRIGGACKDALHIRKPAADGALVAAMIGLIERRTAPPTDDQLSINSVEQTLHDAGSVLPPHGEKE
jgi:hypothetical protein